ncbi:MAG: hypothetical protein HY040_21145 [Planctomycetes bacterium]|nr:hypothetical protein [Planctomycetota bacterium]
MSWTRILGAGTLFFGLVLVGAAGTDTAKRLVGVWEVTKSDEAPPGATVEFTKDGKIKLRAKVKDMEIKVDGTYEVKKDQIVTKVTFGDKSKTEAHTIKKLTDKELILMDEKVKVEEYKRSK